MKPDSTVSLKNGKEMPVLGFGTWDLSQKEAEKSVKQALDLGYKHIDTAEGYKNETGVGKALNKYKREEIFLTSKVLPSNLHYEKVIKCCKDSLDRLNTSYLDQYLIHWPNPAISLRETLFAMKKLYDEGLVKSVGVSNFSIYQLRVALKISEVPITVNQVEFHPWWQQEELHKFCKKNEVVITASAPLARTEVLKDEVIKQLADKYNKNPAQIVLKWELAKGIIPLPKSSSKKHIEENLKIFNWDLKNEDIEKIDQISTEEKVYSHSINDETYGIN